MTRREQNLVDILAALVRLHRDGDTAKLAEGVKLVEAVAMFPSPVHCEGAALDLAKLSPPPPPSDRPGIFKGGVFLTPRTAPKKEP